MKRQGISFPLLRFGLGVLMNLALYDMNAARDLQIHLVFFQYPAWFSSL